MPRSFIWSIVCASSKDEDFGFRNLLALNKSLFAYDHRDLRLKAINYGGT